MVMVSAIIVKRKVMKLGTLEKKHARHYLNEGNETLNFGEETWDETWIT
jgi:hypothetical protein